MNPRASVFHLHRAACVVVAALLCMACSTGWAKGNAWATTEFKVIYAPPLQEDFDRLVNPVFETLEPVARTPEQDRMARAMEQMLHRYAVEYERMGFRDPKLRTYFGRYIVNVYPFMEDGKHDTTAVARANACMPAMISGFPSTLEINTPVVDGTNQAHHELLHEHLAHELFHAIQHKYNMCMADKDPGAFFTEGTAQAVGHDMRYHLTGKERSRKSTQRWGTRSYRRALHKPLNNREAYETAAFWRYIAEYVAHHQRGGRAGIHEYKDVRPDYRYLHRLMEDWKGTSDSQTTILTWLDANLRRETGLGLAAMQAQFLSVYLGFGADDADDGKGKARYADPGMSAHVRNETLGTCTQLTLAGLAPQAQIGIRLQPMQAYCVDVDVRLGPAMTEVIVNARGSQAEQVDQFWIGTLGNLAIGHPIMPAAPSQVGGGYIGTWNFKVPANGKQTFLLLNAMDQPYQTRPVELELSFVMPTFEHSMMPAMTQPPASGRTPRPARGTPADGSRDTVREHADASLAEAVEGRGFTRTVGFGHKPDAGDFCGGKPAFVYQACGPVTEIELGFNLDILPVQSTRSPGGLTAQIITSARALFEGGAGPLATSVSMMARQVNLLEQQDGHGVSLAIPKIEYGFSGTLPASIEMRGKGDTRYAAVSQYLDDHGRRLTGQVTIEEYTPLILRGSFQGTMFDTDPVPGTDPPVLRLKGNLSGRFSSASQIQDARPADKAAIERYVTDNFMQDLFLSTPGIRPETRDMLQTIFDRELEKHAPDLARNPGSGRGGGVSPMSPFPSCDCRCGQAPTGTCAASCSVMTRSCPALSMRPDAQTLSRAADWRKALVERLDARNTGAQVRDMYLSEFDRAQDDDARRLLLRSLDIPTDQ